MLSFSRSFKLRDYNHFDGENRQVLLYDDADCDRLLEDFYSNVVEAIREKKHFPVIRLADGEFQFLLGKNELNLRKPVLFLLRNLAGELFRTIFRKKFEARSKTYTSGVYSTSERGAARTAYAECLKYIADDGIMALYTIKKPNFYTEQYLPLLFDFFQSNNIVINGNNYVPFYFVYIILTNQKFKEIYKNKHVHVITSFDEDRRMSIEQSLFSHGVSSVSWTNISRDKSLFDLIDADRIDKKTDIVFVGAGVGKVNIFNQLRKVSAVVIDAGYILETWQNPQLANERDYCSVTTIDPEGS